MEWTWNSLTKLWKSEEITLRKIFFLKLSAKKLYDFYSLWWEIAEFSSKIVEGPSWSVTIDEAIRLWDKLSVMLSSQNDQHMPADNHCYFYKLFKIKSSQ